MSLTIVGLNHQTAPISVRERLAFAPATLPQALLSLQESAAVTEAMILSTCNRTELYCMGEQDKIIQWLAQHHRSSSAEIMPYLYQLQGVDAVRHTFRVACGLDSMVLGEPQILGQFKDAVAAAQKAGTLRHELNTLFQKTFGFAKEIRTKTAVGENSVSMAAASVKMAAQIFPDISALNVLMVGAGEMIELVATYFAAENPRKLTVLNRTLARAEELCRKLNHSCTQADILNRLPDILAQYDIVVSSTASPFPVIGKGLLERSLKQRRGMPMFLLDLAVPRDIEQETGDLDDAYLYTVDDMADVVHSGQTARKQAAATAENIVAEKVAEFMAWQESRKAVPLICSLRAQADQSRQHTLNKALRRLQKGIPVEEVLNRLSHELTNTLIHAPTRFLNKNSQQSADLSDVITKIYQLNVNKEHR